MSTKIYFARRVTPGQFDSFISRRYTRLGDVMKDLSDVLLARART